MIPALLLIAQTSTSTVVDDREAAALERIEAATSRIANAVEKLAGVKPPEKPGEAAPPSETTIQVNVGAGLIWLAGNSESLTFSGNAALQVKTENWIYSGKAAGAYGKTQAAGATTSAVSALNAMVQLRGDRRFTERVTAYVLGGIETDHVKNIEYRPSIEGGASITWFEEKKEDFVTQSLRTDLGLRYAFEERFLFYPPCPPPMMNCPEMDIEPDDKMLAPRLGIAFRYAVNEGLVFTEELEALPDILATEGKEGTRVLVNSTSKIAIKLTKGLAFGVALGLVYDSQPPEAPGVTLEKLDSSLTVGLEVSF